MPKRRNRTHSNEFREEAVRQVRQSGKPLSRMALELGVNYATLRSWVQQAESPPGERLTESERAELRRLRSEVRELRTEREILKKATVGSRRRRNAMNDRRDHAARATMADERERQGSDLGSMDPWRIAE